MKINIYHAGLAVFRDISSIIPNSRKTENLIHWPEELGTNDILFKPWMNDLKKDGKTKQLIKMFEHIDLTDTGNSPIYLRRKWIADKFVSFVA